jgi:uncharacterized membrane protein YhaH (DUF805 family)
VSFWYFALVWFGLSVLILLDNLVSNKRLMHVASNSGLYQCCSTDKLIEMRSFKFYASLTVSMTVIVINGLVSLFLVLALLVAPSTKVVASSGNVAPSIVEQGSVSLFS